MMWKTGEPVVEWWARGGGITRCGPYESQVEAWKAMRYTDALRLSTRLDHPADTAVWPEEVE